MSRRQLGEELGRGPVSRVYRGTYQVWTTAPVPMTRSAWFKVVDRERLADADLLDRWMRNVDAGGVRHPGLVEARVQPVWNLHENAPGRLPAGSR